MSEGLVWLIAAMVYVCILGRVFNYFHVHCAIISSCRSAAISKVLKGCWSTHVGQSSTTVYQAPDPMYPGLEVQKITGNCCVCYFVTKGVTVCFQHGQGTAGMILTHETISLQALFISFWLITVLSS